MKTEPTLVYSRGRMFTKGELAIMKYKGSVASLNVYHEDDGTLVEVATVLERKEEEDALSLAKP